MELGHFQTCVNNNGIARNISNLKRITEHKYNNYVYVENILTDINWKMGKTTLKLNGLYDSSLLHYYTVFFLL